MLRKLEGKRLRKKIEQGNFNITPYEECFLNYCKKIADENWTEKDYIQAYDEQLEKFVELNNSSQKVMRLNRVLAAQIIVNFSGRSQENE